MARVDNLDTLVAKLKVLKLDADKASASVQVGYTQNYAVYVHENLNARHPVGKAKFLEDPARSIQHDLRSIVYTVYLKTGDMAQALIMAGLRLQRESQLQVPVDTSALKASAFTARDEEAEQVASEVFKNAQAIRRIGVGGYSSTKQQAQDVERIRNAGLKVPKRRRK